MNNETYDSPISDRAIGIQNLCN